MAENNSSAPLLPCPFCGNGGAVLQNESPADNSGGYFVECKSCGASTNLRYACGDDPVPLLVAQWNARSTQAVEAQAPAAVEDGDTTTREQYRRMFEAACVDLGRINEALGLDPDAGGADPILDAIEELRATPERPATENSSAGDMATESVLIEGVAYTIPEAVALELLRLNIELQLAEVQAEPVAWRYKTPTGWHATTDALAISRISRHHEIEPLYTAPQAQPADALDAETIKKPARYDWLRSGNDYQSDGPMVVLYESEGDRGDRPYWSIASDALDASIDAAMAAAQEGGKA